MPRSWVRLDRRLELLVRRLDRWYIGHGLRIVATLMVIGIPVAKEFAAGATWKPLTLFESAWWLLAFFLGVVVLLPLQRYYRGTTTTRLLQDQARINGSFAGLLDDLGRRLARRGAKTLTEVECERFVSGLLHRIRDYTAVALTVDRRPRLRATLAVPHPSRRDGDCDALRVWSYDEPHEDRSYTIIPMAMNGGIAPGAPLAYRSGAAQIIDDIVCVPGQVTTRAFPYRSILSIPVSARSADGRPLAVVSVDADEPNFFRDADVVERVLPLVSPAVNTVGIVLQLRRNKGEPYAFPF